MNYITINDLPEININEIDGSEDIILTKNTDSKKVKINTLYNYINEDIFIDLNKKVDKIDGKGLSDVNFTQVDKFKLDNISENANNYILPISTINNLGGIKQGNYLDISVDGVASISPEIPAKWTNIQSKPELYTKSEIDELITNDSTSLNTPNLSVRRDSSGNFSAGTITANLNGNATSASTLESPRDFTLTGDVTGTISSNLLNGVSINTSVQDDSHSHTISTLTGLQTILDNKVETTLIGATNGIASLNSSGKIPNAQLPSYVDDVLEFTNLASFPAVGESSKIYIALNTNKTYRWSGSTYVYITSGAVDSVNGYTGIINLSKSDIGLENVDNTADINKNVLSASKLTSSKTLSITGDITGTVSSDLSSGFSIASTLANSGVSSGTYQSVTVNSKGLVTSGTNPTTIAGYNISDAYTKTEVQTVLPKVGFDTTATPTLGLGQFGWNSTESTLDLECGGATLQLGQEQLIRVRNNTGSTILNGSAVMATGTLGNSGRITVANANISTSTAKLILGICTEDIAADADGFVTTFGKIRAIQTNGANYGETWVDGDILYVKDTGNGALTKIIPTDTEVKLPIAIVINSHSTNGTLFVRVNSIDENHAKAELLLKAPIASPVFTGNVSGLGVSTGTSFNGITGLSSTLPIVSGTATIGTSTATARADHIHPEQTNITGNAGTATKLATPRNINGVAFDGSADITITSNSIISTTEYSTGSIRNSKPVFGIEVDLGALPNTSFKNVAFTFNPAYTYWIDGQNSFSTDGTEVITIPYFGYIGDGVSVKLDLTNNKIVIIADKDRTAFTNTKLVLNYTK